MDMDMNHMIDDEVVSSVIVQSSDSDNDRLID